MLTSIDGERGIRKKRKVTEALGNSDGIDDYGAGCFHRWKIEDGLFFDKGIGGFLLFELLCSFSFYDFSPFHDLGCFSSVKVYTSACGGLITLHFSGHPFSLTYCGR